MEEKRPDPNELLEKMEQEEPEDAGKKKKGELKIFLGYCAGVGKTYRMLQEAASNRMHGVDIVIGIAETHGRKDTEALLSGLEVIPRKKIEYSGITLDEMDIDAILSRHPDLALVDEFAHTNAPGSRHTKRFQDVEELLNAGIDVFTTLNIQHVESLVDIVYQISGIRVAETVPDRLLEQAKEIELVDLTPEKLVERLKEGKVYIPKKAEQAMHQFFKKGNLLALRELSLHYTAKHVDEDVRSYMEKHAVSGPWPVGSRLLVGITASASSERLIRFTHRMAQDLDAEWFVAYVESPQQLEVNEKERAQLDKNIRLAEELGASVVILKGNYVADEMLTFAREKNVTLIVAGPSRRTFLNTVFKGSVLNTLIKGSGSINILIAGESMNSKANGRKYEFRKRSYQAYLVSFLAILLTVCAGLLLRKRVEAVNIAMLLLLPSIASGIIWGLRLSLFSSILAVAAFDFFFVPPYHTLRVSDVRYLPSFIVFILVSLLTSYFAKSVRQESESSRHRERFVFSLYSFTKAIMAAEGLDEILNRAVKSMSEAFEGDVVIFLPDDSGNPVLKARDKESIFLSETEKAVAVWVYNNGQPAGKSTNTLSSSAWYYLPLKLQDSVIGVAGLKTTDPSIFLTPEQDQLFESFAGVVALAVKKRVSDKA
jgi:two-component system sensor histidine kinase KdpD